MTLLLSSYFGEVKQSKVNDTSSPAFCMAKSSVDLSLLSRLAHCISIVKE